MSALNDDIGGKLNVLVDVPRAMSPIEANIFLMTDVFPDLSQPPPEDASIESQVELTETDARLWLGTLTASSNPIGDYLVVNTRDDVIARDHYMVQTEQINTNSGAISSP